MSRAWFGSVALAALWGAFLAAPPGVAEVDGSHSVSTAAGVTSPHVEAEWPAGGESPSSATQLEHAWGAIAFWSFSESWIAGATANYFSPHDAEWDARERCGGDQCSMAMTFRDECAALAVSVVRSPPSPLGTVRMGWAKGATEAAARKMAIGECREDLDDLAVYGAACAVEIAICSGDVVGADAGTRAELPLEIDLDRFLLRADQAVEERDSEAARSAMERIVALQQEHGVEPTPEDYFRHAQAWRTAGEPERAQAAVTTYLQLLGREASRYSAALELLNQTEDEALGYAVRATPVAPDRDAESPNSSAAEPVTPSAAGPDTDDSGPVEVGFCGIPLDHATVVVTYSQAPSIDLYLWGGFGPLSMQYTLPESLAHSNEPDKVYEYFARGLDRDYGEQLQGLKRPSEADCEFTIHRTVQTNPSSAVSVTTSVWIYKLGRTLEEGERSAQGTLAFLHQERLSELPFGPQNRGR